MIQNTLKKRPQILNPTRKRSNSLTEIQTPFAYENVESELTSPVIMKKMFSRSSKNVLRDPLEINNFESEPYDHMKQLYKEVNSQDKKLNHNNIVSIVDTLIGRRRISFSNWQILADLFVRYLMPCNALKKWILSKNAFKRRRIFDHAESKLRTQFDIQNLLRNSMLT